MTSWRDIKCVECKAYRKCRGSVSKGSKICEERFHGVRPAKDESGKQKSALLFSLYNRLRK